MKMMFFLLFMLGGSVYADSTWIKPQKFNPVTAKISLTDCQDFKVIIAKRGVASISTEKGGWEESSCPQGFVSVGMKASVLDSPGFSEPFRWVSRCCRFIA